MKHKTVELIEVKAEEDGQEPGTFSALASVFGNVDSVGDRVMKGAFSKTLKKWRESGRPLPVILSHQWDNPFATIGKADPRAVMETEDGLLVQGTLDLEHNDTAKQVHRLMKDGLLTGWSFGYTVPDHGEEFKDGANEISEVDLFEVGPTLVGANREAHLQSVKSALDHDAPAIDRPSMDQMVPQDKAARNVGPAARAHLSNLIKYYMSKPHPFTACVRDNTKRFGEEGAKRVCATLKDIGMGTTHWREGHHSGVYAYKVPDAEPERDFVQELYDAAEGDLEGLLEMHHAYMDANGDLKADEPTAKMALIAAPNQFSIGTATTSTTVATEVEKPAEPAKPTAKRDPLKEEIDRLRLEIAVGKDL